MATNAHFLGKFPVAFWRGTAPDFAKQRVSSHTRPGSNGVGRVIVGKSGRQFTSELELHSATYPSAMNTLTALMNLTGRPPIQIVYGRRRLWLAPFRHLFFVDDVQLVSCTSNLRIIGPNYDFVGGAALVVSVQFEPFPLF